VFFLSAVAPLSRRSVLASTGASIVVAGCASTSAAPAPWVRAGEIVRSIRRVAIPRRETSIIDHGARENEDARPAILAAIAVVHAAGGGRVTAPEGVWLSDGPIHLKSNVELHLARGAVLRFLPNPASYLPVVLTRWEGTDCYNYSPFIYAHAQTNIALTGGGTIDGQGAQYWLPWRAEQREDQRRLRDMGRDGVPVSERVFGEGHKLRPHFIQFYACDHVLVDGPTIVNSPFWLVHPVYCSDVIVRNVKAVSAHVNSDGVDIDSSRRVLVEDCDFEVGDDGVAIKSGRDQDGWRVNQPSEDIVLRRCTYSGDAGGGVAIGSEMSGGVKNVFIEDWRIPRAHHGLYFKANLDRGGMISDIFIRNIALGEVDAVLIFTNAYHSYRGGQYPPRFERVRVENIRCNRADVGIHILGHEQAPVRDITIRRVRVDTVTTPIEAALFERLALEDVSMNARRIALSDAVAPGPITP
jgi:polygalacturonase